VALSRLIRSARASAAIGGKADPDQTTLTNWIFVGNKSVSGLAGRPVSMRPKGVVGQQRGALLARGSTVKQKKPNDE
jgi:hypothetical protein